MASPRLVLWDIDGTLLSNDESEETLFVATAEAVLGHLPDIVHPYRHGKTDLQQVTEYLLANGGNDDQVPEGSRLLVEVSAAHFAEPGERVVLAGVASLLTRLAGEGHVNALLTGNGRERAALKLRSAGIDRNLFDWDASFFGDAAGTRPELTKAAAAYAAAKGLAPVIVGDTVADAQAAEAAGIGFIGVATGVYAVAELQTTPHLLVVEDLDAGGAAVLDALAS